MKRELDATATTSERAAPPRVARTATSGRAFWWACAIAAPWVAFATAALGFGIAPHDLVGDVASLVLWSVAEEIVFRGAMQPALLRWPALRIEASGITRANLLTSVVFAACHVWRHPLAVALGVFPVSLVLGRMREKSGRVWPPALFHLYCNLLLYAATLLVAARR
jgi:membrane protease YdiL (CAAX protease family)